MFFQTESIRKTFKAYSKILIIDATYGVFKLKYSLVFIVGVDGNGITEMYGVFDLVEETEANYMWRLKKFVSANKEACAKVNCLMTDKDGVLRTVLPKFFRCPLYICIFHVAQIFNRTFTYHNYSINMMQREFCLECASNMLWSETDDVYNHFYKMLINNALLLQDLKDYFNNGWHNIQLQWCVRFMTEGNLNFKTQIDWSH